MGDAICFAGPLVIIIVGIYYQTGLTFIKIFSALEIMVALKVHIVMVVIGIGVVN